jgi:hypothetical protein
MKQTPLSWQPKDGPLGMQDLLFGQNPRFSRALCCPLGLATSQIQSLGWESNDWIAVTARA